MWATDIGTMSTPREILVTYFELVLLLILSTWNKKLLKHPCSKKNLPLLFFFPFSCLLPPFFISFNTMHLHPNHWIQIKERNLKCDANARVLIAPIHRWPSLLRVFTYLRKKTANEEKNIRGHNWLRTTKIKVSVFKTDKFAKKS